MEPRIADFRVIAGEIYNQIADIHRGGTTTMGPMKNGFKVGHQFTAIKWSSQIAVRARPKCGDFIIYPTIARKH